MPKSKTADRAGKIAIAIMAAGKGTRLKSKHPKVLHEVGGKPLLAHVIAAATEVVAPADVYAIIGHEAERVREAVAHTGIHFVVQEPQRGTGHAIAVAREKLAGYDTVVVLSGDAPLVWAKQIKMLLSFHRDRNAAMTILTADLDNPTGYGRIIRKSTGGDEVAAIVEEKSLKTEQQRHIPEVNSGTYVFQTKPLFRSIDKLTTNNAHREFYLTDMAGILAKAKQKVVAFNAYIPEMVRGVNTRAELAKLDQEKRLAKSWELIAAGATIYYPETCVIDSDVLIGQDTIIEPFVQLLGKTRIGADCRIRSYSVVENSVIGDGVLIRPGCVIEESRVQAGAAIGPYAHLRPGSEIGEGAHVGNFVETKKTRLGKGSKANHLTYLGDSEIGAGVNIGAGTITCNYDGLEKHTTIIEDDSFIGSNATLVAPLRVGKGAYVGAASCVTDDVPADALALGRARQTLKDGWAKQRRQAAKSKS